MKICITCAAGGHLSQLNNIMDALRDHDIFFITVESETTQLLKQVAKTYYTRDNPKILQIGKTRLYWTTLVLYNLYLIFPCIYILVKEKPNVIFGNGGAATLCLSYIGKIFGCKIVYLESLTRVSDLSLTGRLVYMISDLFLVQWEILLKKYDKAKYWGKVL